MFTPPIGAKEAKGAVTPCDVRWGAHHDENIRGWQPGERSRLVFAAGEAGALPGQHRQVYREAGPPWSFGSIAVFPSAGTSGLPPRRSPRSRLPGGIQAKLRVGAADDPLEHQADRVADQVMSVTAGDPPATFAPMQTSRKHSAREVEAIKHPPARSPEPNADEAPDIVQQVLRSAGQPLDAETRAFFEPRFGHNFSRVRVHSGIDAQESARAIGAVAYTFGSDIVFGGGVGAAPRRLLAHELTHVLQQDSASNPNARSLQRSPGGDSHAPPSSTSAKFFNVSRGPLTSREKQKLLNLREKLKLPVKPTSRNTTIVGILVLETGEELDFHSGEFGGYHAGVRPSDVPGGPGSGVARYNRTQVETFAAQAMRKRGIKRAVLLIEKEPCAVCGGYDKGKPETPTKTPAVSNVLPPDAQLLVVDGENTTYFRSARTAAAPAPTPPPGKSGVEKTEPHGPAKTEPARDTDTKTKTTSPSEPTPQAPPSTVSLEKAKNTDFQTPGRVIYDEVYSPPPPEMSSGTGGSAPEIGEGLAQILPEAMSALQDKTIRNNVATQMLQQWSKVEGFRNKYPKDWILCVVSLEEWEQPDPAGQVARMVNYVDFFHGATKNDAVATATNVLRSGVPRGWREVGPFLGWIGPTDSLERARKEVSSHAGFCFIATACYNSPQAPEVRLLREFRDVVLARSRAGLEFIRAYYCLSPSVAKFLRRHAWPRILVRRLLLTPLVATISRSAGRWRDSIR